MKQFAATCMVAFVIMLVSGGAREAEGAVSCNTVVSYLSPCITYVAQGGVPAGNCCTGVKTLYGMAQTAPDRQGVCRCLKSAISGISYTRFNLNNAAALPAKCGVNLPYNISPATNCDTIN